jgi:IstB-like ATP binding protein
MSNSQTLNDGVQPSRHRRQSEVTRLLGDLQGPQSGTLGGIDFTAAVSRWHEQIGDPAVADGILDRLVHNAYCIKMRGD